MIDFFQTKAGHIFTQGTIPRLIRAIEENNELRKKELELKERELKFLKK
ncbi:MAG: hypothetical protein ACOCRX_04600 [Candidatus Woesearchaeota archaeon]